MSHTELYTLISQYAPTIANAALTSISPVAGLAMHLLTNVFAPTTGQPVSVSDLVSSIKADVTAPDKLAQLEAQHSGILNFLIGQSKNFQIYLPSSAEITVKLNWQKDNQST